MTTHFGILAWEIPWTEEHDRISFMGLQRVRHFHFSLFHEFESLLLFHKKTYAMLAAVSSSHPTSCP